MHGRVHVLVVVETDLGSDLGWETRGRVVQR